MGAKIVDAHLASLGTTMKQNKNELWKLDLIETKFFKTTPRLQSTKKLLNARKNAKLLKKLPQTREEAHKQIHALKKDLFEKKFHGSFLKLHREVLKKMKTDLRAWKNDTHESLRNLLNSALTVNYMVEAKLVKIFIAAVLNTKELKSSPPSYLPEDIKDKILNKKNPSNPSRFFIDHCQDDKIANGYISKLWNAKDMKKLIEEIDWSFRKVRGDLTVDEKNTRSASTGKKAGKDDSDDDNDSDSESESDSDSDSESEEESDAASEEEDVAASGSDEEMDAEEAFEKYAAYDNLVAGSDGEGDFEVDLNVDYNEITDEEPSAESEDELDEKAQKKKLKELKKKEKAEKKEQEKKHKLPSLATGYYSGGSDDEDDVDNDKVVKEATTTRKNRRGQRARQKIWEQKYGKKANHVQKEKQRLLNEREQRQQEFQERQRKRDMKARLAREAEEANKLAPKLEKKPQSAASQKMHPSWEAKKIADEKMKAVKFTGKKITFD